MSARALSARKSPHSVRVCAHRGVNASGVRENTFEAFELAVATGADMIEIDVRRTGDGQLAILHDHACGGVTLDSCTLDHFEARTGLRPPLLIDVLEWADGRIGLDVELKEDGYAEQVGPLLQDFARRGNELIVTSFLDPVIARLAEITPELKLGLLLMWTARRGVERAQAAGAQILLPEMKLVRDALIGEVTGAGLELIVWDFIAADHGWILSDHRLSAVITDDVPGALAAVGVAGEL